MRGAIVFLLASACSGIVGGLILAAVIVNSVTHLMPGKSAVTMGKTDAIR